MMMMIMLLPPLVVVVLRCGGTAWAVTSLCNHQVTHTASPAFLSVIFRGGGAHNILFRGFTLAFEVNPQLLGTIWSLH